ncbi:MAG: Phosphoglucomutase [Chlamydiia bacterium]|nr:Phosphoglucomutase [Chlamydiia bacterium]
MADSAIPNEVKLKVNKWLASPFDDFTQKQVQDLISNDKQKLIDAFYTNLSFGTAGLRGVMGVGTNRVNTYTIRAATQGLANYINLVKDVRAPSVVIAHDSRRNSRLFAEESAKVLAANDIDVYLSSDLRPTPFVSFACIRKEAMAAIMITASHNPPEYNGYKVYWEDGAQITPPQDVGIIAEVNKIENISEVKVSTLDNPRIHYLNEKDDFAYLRALEELQNYPLENKKNGRDLHIVFANLHGAGVTLLPAALHSWGFCKLTFVEEQKEPHADFPTTKTPNPEQKQALQLGINKVKSHQADVLIATDPDADRIGVAALHNDDIRMLNGNQIATACLYYLLSTLKHQKRLSSHHAVVSTIVTTEILKKMCTAYKVKYFETLTGFKYIGEKMHEFESTPGGYEFLFGAEESHGYLYGTHAKDKDAVAISCLVAEIASQQKVKGNTIVDLLYEAYKKFGLYAEKQKSIQLEEGQEGSQKMKHMMKMLRRTPPSQIDHEEVLYVEDYSTSYRSHLDAKKQEQLFLPKSNVLVFRLSDESKFIIRPSGTEPKIKIYGMLCNRKCKDIEMGLEEAEDILDRRLAIMEDLLFSYAPSTNKSVSNGS